MFSQISVSMDINKKAHYDDVSAKLYNNEYATNYRAYDEKFLRTAAYRHFATVLKNLNNSFQQSINVLDIGCGTGRFFHLFNNVELLTGIDVSKDMLAYAKDPLPPGQLDINTLELIEGSFFTHDFKDIKYDIIYSIGVLGEHVPFDDAAAKKIYGLLNENGKAYFTIVDLEPRKNTKRKIAETLYPLLPKGIRQKLDARWEICYLTYDELDTVMRPQPFSSYKIERYTSEDPLWDGVHLECFANR